MSGYIGPTPVPQATQTRQSFTATANQTSFATLGYEVGHLSVYLNGVKLNSADFTATNSSDIVLAAGCTANDILEMVAFSTFEVTDGAGLLTSIKTVDGATSGLDADLLDGQHGAYYAPIASPALTGNPTAPTQAESDDSTKVATTAYVSTKLTTLIGGAPSTLDDLSELAAAINNDSNYNSTLTTALATKMPKAGGAFTGNVTFGDGDKAIFGTGSDFEIYHDGGGFNQIIAANNQPIQIKSASENMIKATPNGAIELYHDNAQKFITSSTGVSITGTTTSSGQVKVTGSSASAVAFSVGDTNTGFYNTGSNSIGLSINGANKLQVTNSGNVGIIQDLNIGNNDSSNPLSKLRFGATQHGAADIRPSDEGAHKVGLDFYTDGTGDATINPTFAMRIDALGNVGIGTQGYGTYHGTNRVIGLGSGTTIRSAVSGSDPYITIANNAFHDASAWKYIHSDFASSYEQYNGTHVFNVAGSGNAAGTVSFSEAMRIGGTSAQKVFIGKTSTNFGVAGVEVGTSGLWVTRAGGTLSLNRLEASSTVDGPIIEMYAGTSVVGSIGTNGGDLYVVNAGGVGAGLKYNSGFPNVIPCNNTGENRDNAIDLGHTSVRFDDIYATNGTIQTSDRNEKQDIAALTSTEMLVAKRISALFKTFRWKDKVAAKGDDARTHSGIVAQDVQAAFAAESLDAGNYSMFISSTWWEHDVDVAAVEADDIVVPPIEAADAYTRTDSYDTEDEAPSGSTKKTRLGIRYPELLSFLAAYNEQRFAAIETRLTALEAN